MSLMPFILLSVFVTQCGRVLNGRVCSSDSFILRNMTSCHQLLTCNDIKQLKIIGKLSIEGNVKDVFLSKWGNHDVVLLKLKDRNYANDFKYGLKVLQHLNNDSEFVIQLIGECIKFNCYVTEYHKFGDGRNLLKLLSLEGKGTRTVEGIGLCIRYAEMLHYLHHANPLGTLVLCDSNELMKLLSQMLITDEFKLIMNDMDAFAIIHDKKQRILCGCRNLTGDFVAPEQRKIDHGAMCNRRITNTTKNVALVGYNEKIDIWRIPNVCDYFLKNSDDYEIIKYHLFDIHKQCKNKVYWKRPNAKQILNEYRRIAKQLNGDNYLLYQHDDL